jgi:hypothetical protein
MRQIVFSPSDFTFLWEKEPWAFYEKYKHGIRRPRMNMPKVVGDIDGVMKGCLENKNLKELDPLLPNAKIVHSDAWVQSKPLVIEDQFEFIIRGKIDAALQFEDGTFGVIDYKASNNIGGKMQFYTRQLQAYAYALMNNDPRDLHLFPITRLGIMQYKPYKFELSGNGTAALTGNIEWVEIDSKVEDFIEFLTQEVAPFLMKEMNPPENDPWMQYINSYYEEDYEDDTE